MFAERGYVLTGIGAATPLQAVAASASFFDVLGVQPALGRKFLPEEDRYDLLRRIEELERRSFRQEQVFRRVLDLLEANAAAGRVA